MNAFDSLMKMYTAMDLARKALPPSLGRDEVDGFTISTVATPDQGPETAIGDTNHHYHPVERYRTKAAAQAGHAKWVQFVRDGHRDILKLGYDDLVDPVQMTLC